MIKLLPLCLSHARHGRSLSCARRLYSSDIRVDALVYSAHGQPSDVLRWHSYPLTALTPETVHVKFLAAPINPADVNQIQGVYPVRPAFEPLGNARAAVGGNEGVAEVIAVGDRVSDLRVGDRVVMAKAGYGTWRTFAAGPPEDFLPLTKTENVSLVQQATITVNPCTAYRMLKDFVELNKGDYVIQNAANSAVGQAVIQIAKAWGLSTINVVRNRPEVDALRQELTQLGATHIVTDDQLGSHELRSEIKALTGPSSLLLGLNCVGGKSATEMARLLGANGHYVTYGAMARAPLSLPASLLIFKNITFHGFWVSKWADAHTRQERITMFNDLLELMRRGQLAEPRWTKIEWHESAVKHAVAQGISGFSKGKQVILF